MAVTVKLKDIIEGMEFQSDEGASHLHTTTGEVVYITDEDVGRLKTRLRLTIFLNGSMRQFALPKTSLSQAIISPYPPNLTSMNIGLWNASVAP
jgi:hypothetical protein